MRTTTTFLSFHPVPTATIATAAALAALTVVAPIPAANAQTIVVTAEAAGVQSSQVAGVTTETFNLATTGNKTTLASSLGTYTAATGNAFTIAAADIFGGAGGTGNQFIVQGKTGQTSATLTMGTPQAYLGFWWSAADAGNLVQFYSGATLLGSLNPTIALAALGNAYFGNPNNGGDASQKFAYLNFFGTNGTTFDRIVFSQLDTIGGFESDNHSIRGTQVSPPLSGTVINGAFVPAVTAAPEPGSFTLLAMSVLPAGIVAIRRRRRA